jgi:spore coat polysaccharide biosynthesis protein SpsF
MAIMENDYIVLQVRLRSTRLPNKALLPLAGITIFEHILKRLSLARLPKGIIVATTKDTAPHIEGIAKRYSVPILIGSEEDVLSRYVNCVKKWNIQNVIRATADNPLVCIEYIDRAIELHRGQNADLTLYPLLPYGTGVEVIRGKILEEIATLTNDSFEREHLTQYIYRHEDRYRIMRGLPDLVFQRKELRLTVDTDEDYKRMDKIYRELYSGQPIMLLDVINYLDRVAPK